MFFDVQNIGIYEDRRERFRYILERWLPENTGNIIEIGAGVGQDTVIFLEMAKKYKRKVIVIDPFESGWDNMPESYGKPYPEQEFDTNTSHLKDYLIKIKAPSQVIWIKDVLELTSPYCFAFIDGLQHKEAVLSDLRLIEPFNCLICLDDVNRSTRISQVPEALTEFYKESSLRLIPTTTIEGYLQ